ncbi:hypothetical protein MRX96_014677 [Rhipicephalus microplus]
MPAEDYEATVVIALAVMRIPVHSRGRAGATRHGKVTRSQAGGQRRMTVETRRAGRSSAVALGSRAVRKNCVAKKSSGLG